MRSEVASDFCHDRKFAFRDSLQGGRTNWFQGQIVVETRKTHLRVHGIFYFANTLTLQAG